MKITLKLDEKYNKIRFDVLPFGPFYIKNGNG